MRALLTAACIVLLSAVASAQCGSAPAVDPFAPTACASATDCQTAFCACAGASNTTRNALTCLATSSAGCSVIETCMRTYTKCIVAVGGQRNSADAVCKATGAAIHAAVLQAVVDKYAGSALQTSCRHHVCGVMNSSHMTCNFGTNSSAVCQEPDTTNSFVVRVVMTLSGSAWGQLLNNPTRRTMLETGLRGDVAGMLNISIDYIVILNLTQGSLIVDFAVLTGSPASTAALQAAVTAKASNSSWLTSTKSVYSIVSNETITVSNVVFSQGGTTSAPVTPAPANTTVAPTTPTVAPTPGGTSPSSASSASVLAVAAAVVALLVAM